MSTLTDRLRGLVRPASTLVPSAAGAAGHAPPAASGPAPAIRRTSMDPSATADLLGGTWHDDGPERVLVIERVYRPGHRHGDAVLADALPPADEAWPGLSLLIGGTPADVSGRGLLFVDLETTGLAGGAGTCAFLVGCAWFDGGVLRVRQFFLPGLAAERALLLAVAALAEAAGTVVTYNGRSFDLPLIETRYLYHRMETPFARLPHLDLLPPARRLWRPDAEPGQDEEEGGGCRLIALERTLCGFEREGDVPGFEIPGRYFEFVRTGQARPLVPVVEHNRLDLVSLALLTARAVRLVEGGVQVARTPREALGLGRIYERAGRLDEALECYRHSAAMAGTRTAETRTAGARRAGASAPATVRNTFTPAPTAPPATLAEALRQQAALLRRLRRHDEAAGAWTRLLALPHCPVGWAREAAQALAVHHEHRLRDPQTARTLALRALAHAVPTPAWRRAVAHRVARLDRKLGGRSADPLFQD